MRQTLIAALAATLVLGACASGQVQPLGPTAVGEQALLGIAAQHLFGVDRLAVVVGALVGFVYIAFFVDSLVAGLGSTVRGDRRVDQS